MRSLAKAFFRDERGATTVEYGLLVGLLSLGIIAAVTNVGNELNESYDEYSSTLDTVN